MKIKIRCKVAYNYEQTIEVNQKEISYLEDVNDSGYFDHPYANDIILDHLDERFCIDAGEIEDFEFDIVDEK